MSNQNGTQPIGNIFNDIPNAEPLDLDEQFYQAFQKLNGTRSRESMLSVMREVGFVGNMGGERQRLIEKYNIDFGTSTSKSTSKPKDPIDAAKKKLAREAAEIRQNTTDISLYSIYLTFDAMNALGLSAKQRVYALLAGNVNLQTGVTHRKSRKDWAEILGIGKRTWYRIQAELLAADLIALHPEDGRQWEMPCSFILPHVLDWYNNVERKLK